MIEINNLTTSPVDENFLKKVAKAVLKGKSASRRKKNLGLSIALVGPGRIKELNKKYRKKNRATDVLAFGQSQKSKVKSQKFPIFPKSELALGEIVICLREVKKNAKRFTPLEITGTGKKDKESKSLTGFGSKFKTELARVLIHGILHLLGYEHKRGKKEANKMKKKEEIYLKQLTTNN